MSPFGDDEVFDEETSVKNPKPEITDWDEEEEPNNEGGDEL